MIFFPPVLKTQLYGSILFRNNTKKSNKYSTERESGGELGYHQSELGFNVD